MAKPDGRLVRIVLLLLVLHLMNAHLDTRFAQVRAGLHGLCGLLASLALIALHGHARRRALAGFGGGGEASGLLSLFDPAGAACLPFAFAGFSASPARAGVAPARAFAARAALAGLSTLFLAAASTAAVAALLSGAGAAAELRAPFDAAARIALRLLLLQAIPLPPLDAALLLGAAFPALGRFHRRIAHACPWLLFALAVLGALGHALDSLESLLPHASAGPPLEEALGLREPRAQFAAGGAA